jgi:hypothetical protein
MAGWVWRRLGRVWWRLGRVWRRARWPRRWPWRVRWWRRGGWWVGGIWRIRRRRRSIDIKIVERVLRAKRALLGPGIPDRVHHVPLAVDDVVEDLGGMRTLSAPCQEKDFGRCPGPLRCQTFMPACLLLSDLESEWSFFLLYMPTLCFDTLPPRIPIHSTGQLPMLNHSCLVGGLVVVVLAIYIFAFVADFVAINILPVLHSAPSNALGANPHCGRQRRSHLGMHKTMAPAVHLAIPPCHEEAGLGMTFWG